MSSQLDAPPAVAIGVDYIRVLLDDGVKLSLSIDAARNSKYLSNFIDDCNPAEDIPVHGVPSSIMQRVIEYLNYYRTQKPKEMPKPLPSKPFKELINQWEFDYISQELPIVFELITAANYLDIVGLLELASAKVASEIRGRSVDEIRSLFNIENDFTPEEEKQIAEENKWCESE